MVYADRSRLKSGVGREAMRKRGEMVKRSFAHILDRRGMRRAWLRGRENVHRRCLIHVAGFNLGILMPAIFEQGDPKVSISSARTTRNEESRPCQCFAGAFVSCSRLP